MLKGLDVRVWIGYVIDDDPARVVRLLLSSVAAATENEASPRPERLNASTLLLLPHFLEPCRKESRELLCYLD